MPLHVIAGRSPSGARTALLAEAGEQVRMISRTGGGPEPALIERIAADTRDAEYEAMAAAIDLRALG